MTSPVNDAAAGGSLITIRGVEKYFRGAPALRGVSLDVQRNEFVTLLGPSGCGKTTLLRTIGGFILPDGGTVVVDGRSVEDTPPIRRSTRMVFQQYALFPHMTVGENVAFGLRMLGVPRAERETRVRAVLERVRLPDKVDRKPNQLSGGQQQRVALARAIVTNPEVLLLDEPLAALDLQLRKSMQFELKELQRSLGITFVYVTHDQGEALTMSDHVAVMSEGRVDQVGTGAEIYDCPISKFVARFIGEANIFSGRLVEAAEATVRVELGGAHLVLPRAGAPTGGEVHFMVRPERLRVSRLTGRLSGLIAERFNLGALQRLRIVTQHGFDCIVDGLDLGDYAPGEKVYIDWPDASVRWLN